MKFTLSWLKTHLETTASAAEIASTLTNVGLEVESITDRSADLAPFIVAEILDAQPHPQADKLRVCRVHNGAVELQIVCGAPNARAGLKTVLAQEGVVIPGNGMKIKRSAIRGVESNGMLCSAEELAISGVDSAGIMELPADAPVGAPILDVLGLNDPLFDIAVTPNRADCLGIRGIARDLSAAGVGSLLPLPAPTWKATTTASVAVSVDNSLLCPLFVGCQIADVKNVESPDWLKKRLISIGQKPISALVDITNFFTHDLGRPLHVYDVKKLTGNITVRSARTGESLKNALNGKDYALSEGMTVIADGSGVIGLGGIIGGSSTGCDATTTDVFLEGALFDDATIADTGRKLAIDTDARHRFERHVDPAFVAEGVTRAAQMILDLCGGTASALSITGETPEWKREIHFPLEKIRTLGGAVVEAKRAEAILTQLGFICAPGDKNTLTVTPPSWRADVSGAADLVEEILRIVGYDAIPTTPLPRAGVVTLPGLSPTQKRVRTALRALTARGALECRTWSFLHHDTAALFGAKDEGLRLKNPISTDLDSMRPSLIPNLVDAARRNADRGIFDLALCEVGKVFYTAETGSEQVVAALIRTRNAPLCRVHDTPRTVDAFDAKTDALATLQALGIQPAKIHVAANAPAWYHPGRSGALSLGGKVILGYFGELHPALLQKMDVKFPVVACEIILNHIPDSRGKLGKSRPRLELSDYQAVERDFAFVADETLPAAALLKAIEAADKLLIERVTLFDIYTGKGVEEGKKSLALSVRLQPRDHTLTDAEIEAVAEKIIAAAAAVGAVLRQ